VYARSIKKRRGPLGDTWYLDEVYIVTVRGERQYLWRAVDQESLPHERYANNRAEVSHEHTREQERQMRRFNSPGQAQRFLAVHSQVLNLFRVGRHLHRAANYRLLGNRSFEPWQQVTCVY
jgi:putative transposase